MHYITKALQRVIHEQGGAAAAARSWGVSREAVMRWKRGAYLPTLQAFVRIMAASSSVQRTALFDALVSDAADLERPAGGQ
jgi:DNA-binding phage protein